MFRLNDRHPIGSVLAAHIYIFVARQRCAFIPVFSAVRARLGIYDDRRVIVGQVDICVERLRSGNRLKEAVVAYIQILNASVALHSIAARVNIHSSSVIQFQNRIVVHQVDADCVLRACNVDIYPCSFNCQRFSRVDTDARVFGVHLDTERSAAADFEARSRRVQRDSVAGARAVVGIIRDTVLTVQNDVERHT